MIKKFLISAMIFVGIQSAAIAEGTSSVSQSDFYIGGGFGSNSLSVFDDEIGYQVFGGYKLPFTAGNATHSVEVGYMSTSFEETIPGFDLFGIVIPSTTIELDVAGLWSTYTFNKPLSDTINLIARAGLDFGDDDGSILGVGVEFDFDAPVNVRLEFVTRSNVDSLQVNLAYQL